MVANCLSRALTGIASWRYASWGDLPRSNRVKGLGREAGNLRKVGRYSGALTSNLNVRAFDPLDVLVRGRVLPGSRAEDGSIFKSPELDRERLLERISALTAPLDTSGPESTIRSRDGISLGSGVIARSFVGSVGAGGLVSAMGCLIPSLASTSEQCSRA